MGRSDSTPPRSSRHCLSTSSCLNSRRAPGRSLDGHDRPAFLVRTTADERPLLAVLRETSTSPRRSRRASPAWKSLDVAVLQELVLGPCWSPPRPARDPGAPVVHQRCARGVQGGRRARRRLRLATNAAGSAAGRVAVGRDDAAEEHLLLPEAALRARLPFSRVARIRDARAACAHADRRQPHAPEADAAESTLLAQRRPRTARLPADQP